MIFLGDLSTSRPQANTGQPDGDVRMSAVLGGEMSPHAAVKPPERVPKCRARQIVSQGIYCSVEPKQWAV